jgi:hypothetical protein
METNLMVAQLAQMSLELKIIELLMKKTIGIK